MTESQLGQILTTIAGSIATFTVVNLVAIFWRTANIEKKSEVMHATLSGQIDGVQKSMDGRGGLIERVEHLEEKFDKEILKADTLHKDYELKLQDHARRLESVERRSA